MKRRARASKLASQIEQGIIDLNAFVDIKNNTLTVPAGSIDDADLEVVILPYLNLPEHAEMTAVNLSQNAITNNGAILLANFLLIHPDITSLDLRRCQLGADGIKALVEALKSIDDRSIILDLHLNHFGSAELALLTNLQQNSRHKILFDVPVDLKQIEKNMSDSALYLPDDMQVDEVVSLIENVSINEPNNASSSSSSSSATEVTSNMTTSPSSTSKVNRPPLFDGPSLQDLAYTVLEKQGLFSILIPENATSAYKNKVALFYQQNIISKLMPEFLQAVVDDDRKKVSALLDKCPELLVVTPDENLVIESKLTWQKFYAEKALNMAAKRKQFFMFNLLLSYFNKLNQDDNAVKAARAEGISAWKCYDMQNTKIIIPEEYTYYLKSLINIISREVFPNEQTITSWAQEFSNGTRTGKRLSEEAEFALTTLLNMLIPNKAVKLDDYLDVELFLLAAYEIRTNLNWARHSAFCIRVIGLIQGVLPPDTQKIFCTGLADMAKSMKAAIKQGDNITGCTPFSVLPKQHKLTSGEEIYRSSRDSQLGLGFKFLFGMIACKGRYDCAPETGCNIRDDWREYMKHKQQFFEKLCSHSNLNQANTNFSPTMNTGAV